MINQERRQVQKYKNLLSRTGSFMPFGIHQLLSSLLWMSLRVARRFTVFHQWDGWLQTRILWVLQQKELVFVSGSHKFLWVLHHPCFLCILKNRLLPSALRKGFFLWSESTALYILCGIQKGYSLGTGQNLLVPSFLGLERSGTRATAKCHWGELFTFWLTGVLTT